jgi:hypothetical protein
MSLVRRTKLPCTIGSVDGEVNFEARGPQMIPARLSAGAIRRAQEGPFPHHCYL